jgi:hypothetical protein
VEYLPYFFNSTLRCRYFALYDSIVSIRLHCLTLRSETVTSCVNAPLLRDVLSASLGHGPLQEAKFLELRATMSLARLWQQKA